MLDESLLFRMGYLFPDISLLDVALSLFLTALFVFFVFFSRKKKTVSKISLPPFPYINDPHFEILLAEHIRTNLAIEYAPTHARAHTASEIARYAQAHPLLTLLGELESIEYQSKQLSPQEREDIIKKLKKMNYRFR